MSMLDVILKSLTAYALLIVIGFLAAYMIQIIVKVLSAQGQQAAVAIKPETRLPATTVVATSGPPTHHLVAIAAAVYTMNRRVRIVHLKSDSGVDVPWTSVGRSLHQASHQVRR
ncbi:MAG: hypothetical protein H7833_17730 [Magnetococcus sp. DMHC-1]|nr:hypothetical protein [Magnetococcales bacterium]